MRIEAVIQKTNLEPRPYQIRIVQKAIDMFTGNYKNGAGNTEQAAESVLIESPTGSGKTPMGLMCGKTMQVSNDVMIAWVAMRRNLLAQAGRENIKHNINAEMRLTSMFEKYPEELIPENRVNGYSIHSSSPRDLLLVVDEAQHDSAASMIHLHTITQPKWSLGLTATPFRTDRMKLVFNKVIKDAGIHQLIQDGYLSPYDHYSIPDWDVKTVAEFYLREPERWGKSICFYHTLDECFAMQREMHAAGVTCEVVTGDSDREQQLQDFSEGKIAMLVNCMVLTEGFDCPDLQTVWCRDSSKGPTMQMCGRVFRRHASVPVKQIVQSQKTHWPIMRTAMPHQQWLWMGSDWRSLKVNPLLERANLNARRVIAATEVVLPKLLTENKKKVRRINI